MSVVHLHVKSTENPVFSLCGVGRLLLATAVFSFISGLPDSLRIADCLILTHC